MMMGGCVFVFLVMLGSVGAQYPLGKSLILRKQDIVNPNFDGKDIFQKLPPNCFVPTPEDQQTTETRTSYRNTETFYKKIATESGLSVNLQGEYTMGATLNIKTQALIPNVTRDLTQD